MEILHFQYQGTKAILRPAHVGVVGSGDLEILMEPAQDGVTTIVIRTRFDGYQQIWKALLDRFFAAEDIIAHIEINDFGATPGMVSMRLLQALEVSHNENNEG